MAGLYFTRGFDRVQIYALISLNQFMAPAGLAEFSPASTLDMIDALI